MKFVCDQAKKHNVTPIPTFDQPLWWKAMCIIQEEPEQSSLKSVVLRLGGLHLQMSFVGAIGQMMSSSGIEDILSLIYAENVVPHILSGKAVTRAFCAHMIIDAALNSLLIDEIYGTNNISVYVNEDDDENEHCFETLERSLLKLSWMMCKNYITL